MKILFADENKQSYKYGMSASFHKQFEFDSRYCTAKMSRRVQQTYQDHSNDVDVDVEIKANTKGGVYLPFPEKLFQMLTHIDLYEPDLACIVSWRPHGRCFLVRDTGRFEENILSRFFKMTKYTSFRRQLNLWGFKRLVRKTPDFDAYYHELCLRSKPFLHRRMQREKDLRAPPNPDGEPDFYSMVPLPPSSSILAGAAAAAVREYNESWLAPPTKRGSICNPDGEPDFYSVVSLPPSSSILAGTPAAAAAAAREYNEYCLAAGRLVLSTPPTERGSICNLDGEPDFYSTVSLPPGTPAAAAAAREYNESSCLAAGRLVLSSPPTKRGAICNPDGEPNFYSMVSLSPSSLAGTSDAAVREYNESCLAASRLVPRASPTKRGAICHPDGEPDFYSMAFLPPILAGTTPAVVAAREYNESCLAVDRLVVLKQISENPSSPSSTADGVLT